MLIHPLVQVDEVSCCDLNAIYCDLLLVQALLASFNPNHEQQQDLASSFDMAAMPLTNFVPHIGQCGEHVRSEDFCAGVCHPLPCGE